MGSFYSKLLYTIFCVIALKYETGVRLRSPGSSRQLPRPKDGYIPCMPCTHAHMRMPHMHKLMDGMQLACYLRPWLTCFALTDVVKANVVKAMVHFQDL